LRDPVPGGITVIEAAGADQPIVRLPTATTGFVGRALRGPVNRPVRIRGFAEFQQVFGGLWQPSMLAYAVEQFFDNGGREAVVVRVVNGGTPATISLPCGEATLTLEALSPGSREVLRASVDYDNIASGEEDRFNLVVQRLRALGSEHIEDQEIFRRLSTAPGTTRFVANALQESQLVRVRGEVPAERPDRTFRPGTRHPIGYIDSNPDGDDGAPLTDYDLIGSAERGTGLFALRPVEDLHFVCIPPPARDRDVGPGVLLVAAQFCRDRRALLVVDPPAAWQTCDDALQGLRELAFQSDHAVMCFPRVQAFDRLRGRDEPFANCGAVAGALARMDAHHSPWDAGPDEPILLRTGTRPLHLLNDADCQRLVAQGLNPLQGMRPGGTSPGALKTLARGTGAGADSSLLTTRRRQLLALNSIEQGTRWARFEARDRNTWPRLARQVRTFLLGLTATGAFGKGASLQSGEVACDERVNSELDLAAGVVHCLVSLPASRAGMWHSFMITHRLEGTTVRAVKTQLLPSGTRMTVRESLPRGRLEPALDDTVPRRTLAQELFAPMPDQRPAVPSDVLLPEAAAARRHDLNLIARLHGEPERRGERF
jgi:Bacteriophage tail sheath protein